MIRFLRLTAMRTRYFLRYGLLGLALVGLFVIPTAKAGPSDNGSGFLWSPNFGWISLNCFNDWNGDGTIQSDTETQCSGPGGNYGVTLSVAGIAGTLTGYAWSPNLGLVCFGDTCRDVVEGGGMTPDGNGSLLNATFDFNDETRTARVNGQLVAFVTGWARIINGINPDNQNDGGWIRLAGIPGTRSAENGGVGVRVVSVCVGGEEPDCEGGTRQSQFVIAGSAWQRNVDDTGVGWIYFGDSPPGDVPDDDANAGTDEEVPVGLRRYDTENQTIDNRDGCGDSIDNDQDDGINNKDASPLTGADCADYDCAVSTYPVSGCPDQEREVACFDDIDNDLDAYVWNENARRYVENQINGKLPIDCGDPNCADAQLGERRCTQEELVKNTYNGCYNGTDDDGDQRVDCDDRDCNSPTGYALCPERIPTCLCASHTRAQGYNVPVCNERTNDSDQDGVINSCDNCPNDKNPNQEDTDADGVQGAVSGKITGGDACDPVAWLETRSGPLYAYKLGGTPPPSGAQGYTATYCILTSGEIVPNDFTSEFCGTGSPSGTRPSSTVKELRLRQYGTNSTQDSLVFSSDRLLRARLDVSGLKAGRYGKVQELGEARDDGQSLIIDASTLENPSAQAFRVYHHRGDLTLTGDATFANGVGSTQSGARLIFVENGDLTITGNLAYTANGGNLRNLASMGFFVVGGDIKIDPTVLSIVGTYITTGTLSTGASTSQLDVVGLLVAQKFQFERTYASLERGAERVIYDGRAALNPPPGFADFLKTLPTFRSIAPR